MKSMRPFIYGTDDRRRISEHFDRLGKLSRFEVCIEVLERSADWYLRMHAWDKALPNKADLETHHADELESLRRVQEIMIRQCGPTFRPRAKRKDPLEDDEVEAALVGEINTMYGKFQRGQIAGVALLLEMGVRAIDELILHYGNGSPEARWVKDGRKKQHRRTFLRDVAILWAGLNGKDLSECKISAVGGSPMLDFIKACIEPLAAITGEFAGDETIKNIVGELKRESQQSVEFAE